MYIIVRPAFKTTRVISFHKIPTTTHNELAIINAQWWYSKAGIKLANIAARISIAVAVHARN